MWCVAVYETKITGKEDTDTIYEIFWGLRRQASGMNEWDGMHGIKWVGHGNEEGGMGREGRKAGLDGNRAMRRARLKGHLEVSRQVSSSNQIVQSIKAHT